MQEARPFHLFLVVVVDRLGLAVTVNLVVIITAVLVGTLLVTEVFGNDAGSEVPHCRDGERSQAQSPPCSTRASILAVA